MHLFKIITFYYNVYHCRTIQSKVYFTFQKRSDKLKSILSQKMQKFDTEIGKISKKVNPEKVCIFNKLYM